MTTNVELNVLAYQAGHTRAFGPIYRAYVGLAWLLAEEAGPGATTRTHDKADMAQEALLGLTVAVQIWEDGRAPFHEYARLRMRWAVSAAYRKQARYKRGNLPEEAASDPDDLRHGGAGMDIAGDPFGLDMAAARLHRLNERERLLVSRVIEGCKQSEIASELGCNQATISRELARIKEVLTND